MSKMLSLKEAHVKLHPPEHKWLLHKTCGRHTTPCIIAVNLHK